MTEQEIKTALIGRRLALQTSDVPEIDYGAIKDVVVSNNVVEMRFGGNFLPTSVRGAEELLVRGMCRSNYGTYLLRPRKEGE